MTKLPGMSLLCVLIAAVFAFSSIVPVDLSASAAKPAAAVKKASSKKKSKRSRKRSRRTACTTASRAAGKKQAYALLSTQSPELCRLTGVQYSANRDTIINTAELLASDGELALDQQGADQPYEEGEIISELEQEDDVTPDLEAFRTLWLSMVNEREKEDAITPGGVPKEKLADLVMDWLGTRYHFGGSARTGIDCSAFTQMLFSSAFSVQLPRTSVSQATVGESVSRRSDLQFGDLVFFRTRSRRGISHVGMYLGDNLFAHSSSRYGVTISSLESTYYSKRLVAARRLNGDAITRMASMQSTPAN
ncbi:MAG: C40 family peptidase [Ignavibacteria bacterium]|jgi:cell wall-associated NlpC family hydrolase